MSSPSLFLFAAILSPIIVMGQVQTPTGHMNDSGISAMVPPPLRINQGGSKGGNDCFVDVACSLADDWRSQVRSVVFFLREDGGSCTGVLLNNTAEDYTPYVQIANHCYAGNPANWVYYFNYEKPGCGTGVAPMNQTITGAQLIAADYDGDFSLLQLNSTPPPSYHPYYAGWDNSGNIPSDGAFIGHPITAYPPAFAAVKKIGTWSTAVTGAYPGHTKPAWVADITQGEIIYGSSGSPMLDANMRVIGAVVDGDIGCDGTRQIIAPKFSENWNGSSSSNRLKDWLDPNHTGASTLNGKNLEIKVKVKLYLQGAYDQISGLMRADLDVPVTEPYTASGYTHHLNGGGETTTTSVLTAMGNARIVDWVVIELRETTTPYEVVATRSALLRRDGLVAALDGSLTGVLFDDLPAFSYRIAIRHRNHLGVMTNSPHDLLATTITESTLDFSTNSGVSLYGTEPTTNSGLIQCLWMGDVTADGTVKYTGSGNDRDPILALLGGNPNSTTSGYFWEDTNLDGIVKYSGVQNDRDPILIVLNSYDSNATRNAQLP